MTGKARPETEQAATAGGLTPRQELFVASYLANGGNATQAAIAAGYSPVTAESQGSRLLRNDKVRQAVGAARTQVLDELRVTRKRIRRALAAIAFAEKPKEGDLAPAAEGGVPDAIPPWPARLKALELLGKERGMFAERVKHEGGISVTLLDPYAKKPEGA